MVRAQKPKLMLEQQTPGPLPGTPILWRCWKTEWVDETMQERRRVGEPRVIETPVRSAIEAKHQACREFWPYGDPLSIDVEWILPPPKPLPDHSDPSTWPHSALRPRPPEEGYYDDEPEPEPLRPTNPVTGFQAPPRYEPPPRPPPRELPDPPRPMAPPELSVRDAMRGALHRLATAVAKHTNGSGK